MEIMKNKVLIVLLEPIDSDGRVQRQVAALRKYADVHCICCVNDLVPDKELYTSIGKYSAKKTTLIRMNIYAFYTYIKRFRQYRTIFVNNIETSIFSFLIKLVFGHRVNIIYDSHELAVPDPDTGKSSFSKLSLFLERVVVNLSNFVIAANKERAMLMKEYYNLEKPPVVIPNYLELEYSGSESELIKEKKPHIVYQGVMNNNRFLEEIVRAFAFVSVGQLHLVGDGPYKKKLVSTVKDLGIQDRVIFHNKMPRSELYTFTKSFKYGLVAYDFSNINNRLCAPNKVSEYLLNGIPIICTPQESLLSIVNNYNVGFCFRKEDLVNKNYKNLGRDISIALQSSSISQRYLSEIKKEFSFEYHEVKFSNILNELL